MSETTVSQPRPVTHKNGADVPLFGTRIHETAEAYIKAIPPVSTRGPILRNRALSMYADIVDDLEAIRKANQNRLFQLVNTEPDEDGIVRGAGLPVDDPGVVRLRESLEPIGVAEKMAVKNLEKAMAEHPLGPWIKDQNGLGFKTTARLLAAIGDPYWNDKFNRPRTVSELWAYCGLAVHEGHAQRRKKGVQSNWSENAKMRLWNMVQPIIKNRRSPYRTYYDEVKAKMVGSVYDERYAGRKLNGKLIEVGQPLSDGHIHSRAQRRVMKKILLDLWVESKRLHEEMP